MSNEILFLGGLFNYVDPFLGFQLYLWLFLGLIVVTVIAWLAWRYGQWEPYKPVWGLFYSFKAGSQVAFIFNSRLMAELVSEREAKCIFDYSKWNYRGVSRLKSLIFNYATVFLPDLPLHQAILYKYGGRNMDVEIAKKMQNYEWEQYSSASIGGIHADIVLDADNWTVKGSPSNKAIERQTEQWNDANPTDEIHSFGKYLKYINEKKLEKLPGVKYEVVVPWSRIDAAYPVLSGTNEDSGAIRQIAREEEERDRNELTKYYMPIIGAGVLIILGILAFRTLAVIFT